MSRIISFAQMLAIAKGANYVNPLYFTPITFNTFTTSISLQPIPYIVNYLPNTANANSLIFTTANSAHLTNNALTFKNGGRLSTRKAVSYYPRFNIKSGNSPKLCYGDMITVISTAILPSSGYATINGKELRSTCLSGLQTTRNALFVDISPDGSTTSSYAGGYFPDGADPCLVYWKGNLEPIQKVNNDSSDNSYEDLFFYFGFFRDHAGFGGASGVSHTPTGGLTTNLNVDTIFGFAVFVDSVTLLPEWWTVECIADINTATKTVTSTPTNLSALTTQELEVEIIDDAVSIQWKANGTIIRTSTVDPLVFDLSIPINVGISLRNKKFQRVAIVPNANQEYITKQLVARFVSSVTSTETQLHNTGLQLLKKLK